ncbi:MAG: DUF7487 domain-containing protein [Nitrosopumilaceae archaeon]
MTKSLGSGVFIERCSKLHSNYYNYSAVQYLNTSTKIKIICPIHGLFEQTAADHLAGCGCRYCISQKRKSTNLKRYGVENPFQSKQVQEKQKQTMIKRYGVPHNSMLTEVVDKRKQTWLKNYGADHPCKLKELQERRKKSCLKKYGVDHPQKAENVRCKTKHTNLHKYGVDHPWKLKEILEKRKETWLKNYGMDNPNKSFQVLERTNQTNIKRYGHMWGIASEAIREKAKQTNVEKYGVDNPFKSKEIQQKIKQTSLQKYDVEFPNQRHLSKYCLEKLYDSVWLTDQHHKKQRPINDISQELQIDNTTLIKYVKINGIEQRYYYRYSYVAICWLESIMEEQNTFIQHAANNGEYHIPNTKYFADGYCKKTNTIYEFYGDVFHGNPNLFRSDIKCHPFNRDMTAGELYQKTIERENIIKSLGYNLETMWENECKYGIR